MADLEVRWTRNEFTLSPLLPIDADTRRRVEALTAGFAERQRPLYERWARELLADPQDARAPLHAVGAGAGARFLIALADWRLRSGGAVHEALLQQAAVLPAACRMADDATTSLDEIAALVQLTPPAERDAFIDGERRLLAQWGDAPPALAISDEDVSRDIARWAHAIRHGEQHDTPSMAPRLAGLMFADPPQKALHAGRCAARQWWLATRLHQAPGAGEAIWQAWHLAFARDLMTPRLETPLYPDATSSVDYPPLVLQLGIGGAVTVSVDRDARGRFKNGVVTKRELAIATLPDLPIPMFDHLLDGPSLARARQLTNEQAAAAAPGASAATAGNSSIRFEWRLQ